MELLADDTLALVRRARQRDAAAFAGLIERTERSALGVAWGVLGNADAAADAVQEAFLTAWSRIDQLKDDDSFVGWLMRIVRTKSIDVHRRRRKTVELTEAVPAEAPDELELERREQNALLTAALAELDELSRQVLALRYFDGLSSKEIAARLETTATAVDMRMMRAKRRLAEIMGEESDSKPCPTNSTNF